MPTGPRRAIRRSRSCLISWIQLDPEGGLSAEDGEAGFDEAGGRDADMCGDVDDLRGRIETEKSPGRRGLCQKGRVNSVATGTYLTEHDLPPTSRNASLLLVWPHRPPVRVARPRSVN